MALLFMILGTSSLVLVLVASLFSRLVNVEDEIPDASEAPVVGIATVAEA